MNTHIIHIISRGTTRTTIHSNTAYAVDTFPFNRPIPGAMLHCPVAHISPQTANQAADLQAKVRRRGGGGVAVVVVVVVAVTMVEK